MRFRLCCTCRTTRPRPMATTVSFLLETRLDLQAAVQRRGRALVGPPMGLILGTTMLLSCQSTSHRPTARQCRHVVGRSAQCRTLPVASVFHRLICSPAIDIFTQAYTCRCTPQINGKFITQNRKYWKIRCTLNITLDRTYRQTDRQTCITLA